MSELLDELARTLVKPMPRSRAVRLLGGALVSAAIPALRPRRASGAPKRAFDPCDHPLRCVGKQTCGIPDPNAGPSPIPVCGVTCCTALLPQCFKWPELQGRQVTARQLNGSCQTAVGISCCCPPGTKRGDLAAGELACKPQVCGPDVTGALEDVVSRTEAAFGAWSSLQRDLACFTLVETPIGAVGWEINQLGPGGREESADNFRPECATCTESLSVQVGSGCHYAGSVNYVIYGVMLRLCHDHLESTRSWKTQMYSEEQMARYVTLWKTLRGAPNLTASLRWARAGYNGWPGGATPPAELPNCAKCPKKVTSRMTVRWLPLDRSI